MRLKLRHYFRLVNLIGLCGLLLSSSLVIEAAPRRQRPRRTVPTTSPANNRVATPTTAKSTSASANGTEDKSANSGVLTELQKQIQAQLAQSTFTGASIGVRIISQQTGETIFEQDANKLLLPASNMKIFTTAAALESLDANYRIRTSVYAVKPPDKAGSINGDLTLFGRGDPSLASRFVDDVKPFDQLAKQLIDAGVKQINGNLIADESYLRGAALGDGWEWLDIQWYFGSEVSALTAYDNSIDVLVTPGEKVGQPCRVTITPDVGYVSILNRIVTVARNGKRDVGMDRGLADNSLLIWGSLPAGDSGFQARIAIHQPAGFAGWLFKKALEDAGIKLTGTVKVVDSSLRATLPPLDPTKTPMLELAAVESVPISEIVKVVNKFSHNLYAELLLRVMGKLKGPADLENDAAGIEVIKQLLVKAGVDPTRLSFNDGSGLSRRTLVDADAIVKLLKYIAQRPTAELFKTSLPLAATDGTLRRRMAQAGGNSVRAKTGTLTNTTALSGYVTSAQGEEIIFSIIFNHYTGNLRQAIAAEDAICLLLANFPHKISATALKNSDKK